MDDTRQKTILVVEDEPLIAMEYIDQLSGQGYRIIHAANGNEAIAVITAKQEPIDLILMDIDLGKGIDGVETAEIILSHIDLPIIFVSSHQESAIIKKTERITSYGYVIKSNDYTALNASIKMAFRLFSAHKAIQDREYNYRVLFENSLNAVGLHEIVLDEQGNPVDFIYLQVNPAFEKHTGQRASEIINRRVTEFFPEIVDTDLISIYGKVALTGESISFTTYFKPLNAYFNINVYQAGKNRFAVVFENITERKRAEQQLQKIEWMLHPRQHNETERIQEYGDLTSLNTSRLILDTVGKPILTDIVSDYLDLLQTSAAVYEKNGDYALGIFASDWCKLMDAASRALAPTPDNRKALDSGLWHCHESCWREASVVAMETDRPVDIECAGGIHLYAVPICANNEIIGCINFGYGDPPTDADVIRQLAGRFQISEAVLRERADAYESRPLFIIEMAKKRLLSSARLIGEIVERKQAQEKIQKLLQEKELILKEVHHRIKNNMNTVYSLLSLQANLYTGQEAKNILLDSAGRVQSMMLLYDKLYRSENEIMVSIKTYVSSLVDEIAAIFPGRELLIINKHIEDIQLNAGILSSLGIIINELITNAIKYAFPEGRAGAITVSISRNNDTMKLIFEDNGIGIAESVINGNSSGFGMQLVRMLVMQIEGTLKIERRDGTRFIIDVPI